MLYANTVTDVNARRRPADTRQGQARPGDTAGLFSQELARKMTEPAQTVSRLSLEEQIAAARAGIALYPTQQQPAMPVKPRRRPLIVAVGQEVV